MLRYSKCYVIALRKKREPKSVHSIIRIDYIPGCSNDFEPDNPSLEERENLVSDTENVAEDGISLSEDYWIFVLHKGQRTNKKIGRDKRFALKVVREIDGRLEENDLSIFSDPIPTFEGIR